MAEPMTVGERLISYWNGQTVVVRAPVSTESLRAFEGDAPSAVENRWRQRLVVDHLRDNGGRVNGIRNASKSAA